MGKNEDDLRRVLEGTGSPYLRALIRGRHFLTANLFVHISIYPSGFRKVDGGGEVEDGEKIDSSVLNRR